MSARELTTTAASVVVLARRPGSESGCAGAGSPVIASTGMDSVSGAAVVAARVSANS